MYLGQNPFWRGGVALTKVICHTLAKLVEVDDEIDPVGSAADVHNLKFAPYNV